jgi:hypothetical protein
MPPIGRARITSPPQRWAKARAALVESSFSRISPWLSHAWKLPGDVSTSAAGANPSSFIRLIAAKVKSSTRLRWCSPAGRMKMLRSWLFSHRNQESD